MLEDKPSSLTAARLGGAAVVLIIFVALLGGYAMHERNVVNGLTAQNAQVTSALTQTQGQIEALNAKLNTLATPAPKPSEAARPSAARSGGSAKSKTARVRRDDPRWKKFQAELAAQKSALDEQKSAINEQKSALDATRQDLAGTRTELSGSIARTHEELVVLQKKGERNYYEFSLDKSKQFVRNGPFGIRVKKANVKNQYADLELMVDDVKLSKKHVNLLEPVMFYTSDSGTPVEMVINSITKDHIRGYVSEPKYRRSELASMSNAASSGNTAQSAAPAERQRMTVPKY